MARDLIPPPSPAGRPATRDGIPNLIELPPDSPGSPAEPAQGPPPAPSQFRGRFGFLLGALGGVFIAAAVALVVVLGTSVGDGAGDGLEPNWSTWQPTDTSIDGGAAQIAGKVGAEYRHPDGKQLTLVTGGALKADIALRSESGDITVIDDPGVIYKLDGLGPNGSILGGTPSAERLKVVRRQALELALYTFRYLPEVEQVVTLLPSPPPTASTPDPIRNAVFYRPGDLKSQLQMPLEMTLPAAPPTADTLSRVEAATIDLLTSSNVFKWSVPDAHSGLLVLDR